MEPMINEFYDVMGWDAQGRPTLEKLAQLGIILPQPNTHSTPGG
jgi:aldehyde:ferredoxin oxidoreductase